MADVARDTRMANDGIPEQHNDQDSKPVYKSFRYGHFTELPDARTQFRSSRKGSKHTVTILTSSRKKFRKMMHTFDEKMHRSNQLYVEEHQGELKARKLAIENE